MSSTAEAIGAPVLALGRRLVQLTSATRAPLGLSQHANGEGKEEAEALFAELLKKDPKGIDRLVQHHAHEASGQEKGEKVEYLQKLLQAVIEHKPALQPRVTEALVLAMNEGAEIHEKSNAISYFSMKLDCLPGVDAAPLSPLPPLPPDPRPPRSPPLLSPSPQLVTSMFKNGFVPERLIVASRDGVHP